VWLVLPVRQAQDDSYLVGIRLSTYGALDDRWRGRTMERSLRNAATKLEWVHIGVPEFEFEWLGLFPTLWHMLVALCPDIRVPAGVFGMKSSGSAR